MPSLKHSFVCLLADDPVAAAAGEVLPSHHNAEHLLTQAAARILGRVTAGTGAVEELTAAQVKTLLAISAGDVSGLFSGAYADLTGKPTLFDGAYSSLTGLPTLGSAAAAATSDFLAANGTAALATALATPRAINGVNFDGTAAITVAAAAGTLTGATLAAGVVASSLTSAAGGSFGSAAFTAASAYEVAGAAAALSASLAAVAFSGAYSDLTGAPGAGATLGANTFTALQTVAEAVAAASTDGIALATTTAATAGAQKWSPRLRWTGSGWKTDATAAAQVVDWIAEVLPVQGAAAPTANFVISSQINGGGYTSKLIVTSAGQVQLPAVTTSMTAMTFGGTTSSFPGLRNNSGELQAVKADFSGSANFEAAIVRGTTFVGGAYTASAFHGFYNINTTAYLEARVGALAIYGLVNTSADLFLNRSAAAVLQQGAADAASPVTQTLQAQGSRTGTDSNVAGARFNVRPGKGSGNATPNPLVLQSYVAVASGTGAQTATDTVTCNKGGVTIGVGGLILPTSDPLIVGAWWDSAGTLTKSAG